VDGPNISATGPTARHSAGPPFLSTLLTFNGRAQVSPAVHDGEPATSNCDL